MPNGKPSPNPEINSVARLHRVLRTAGRIPTLRYLGEDELTARQLTARLNKFGGSRTTQTVLGILESLLLAGLVTASPTRAGRVFAATHTEIYYLLNALDGLVAAPGTQIIMPTDPDALPARNVSSRFASPLRVGLIRELLKGEPQCVVELAEGLGAQPSATSDALSYLGAWMVRDSRNGRRNYYSVRPAVVKSLERILGSSIRLQLKIEGGFTGATRAR